MSYFGKEERLNEIARLDTRERLCASEKQLRRFLYLFKSNGFLRTEGQNRNTIYLLGDSYTANNSLINKALAIGLKELKEKGEL